jgi:aspartokinase/homoserine dehydrogenase 1
VPRLPRVSRALCLTAGVFSSCVVGLGLRQVVGVDPLWELTAQRTQEWFRQPEREGVIGADCAVAAPIVVVTGFVAATLEGTPTTLKRSGSDYSATIFARLMSASRITMWKDVNGVYTADPRRVPEAFPIERLKYVRPHVSSHVSSHLI